MTLYKLPFKQLLLIAAVMESVSISAAFLLFNDLEAWQMATRFTGRASLLFFTGFFLLSAGSHPARPVLLNWSAIFATMHLIHFAFIVTYNSLKGGFPVTFKLAGGITAYVIIGLLPVFSAVKPPGPGTLSAALHFVLLIFALTYASRLFLEPVPGFSPVEGWIGFVWCFLLAGAGWRLRAQREPD
jgi:hypothetical protein